MLRVLCNLSRSILYLSMCGLVGYYSFESGGLVSVATNLFFFSLGILMVSSWQKKPKKQLEQLSEKASLNDPNTNVNVVESQDMTVN